MLLSRLPSSSVRVFPFCRRSFCLPDCCCFAAASLLAQRRPWCPAVFADVCPALSFGRKHQTRRRPSSRLTSPRLLTFALNSSFPQCLLSSPFSAWERRRVAPPCDSATWMPSERASFWMLVSHDQYPLPYDLCAILTPFGTTSHGIVHAQRASRYLRRR